MREFFNKILLLLLVLLIGSILLDYFISINLTKCRSVEYAQGEGGVWDDIYKSKINVDIAIYGSSLAWVQLDPAIIKDTLNLNAYNFGIDGHNIVMQYLRHKEYLKFNPKPKYIIYLADLSNFNRPTELYNMEQFMPYVFNSDIKAVISTYKGYDWFDLHLPLVRYYGHRKVINSAFKNALHIESKYGSRNFGYLGQEANWDESYLRDANKKMKCWDVKVNGKVLNLFEEFIKNCLSQNIKLIFVCPPEHILGQKFICKRNYLLEQYNYFSEKYKIPFVNFSSDSICNNKFYFYNARHLNKIGAEIFTRKLVSIIKNKMYI